MWYFIQVVICGSLMISDVEMISCSCWPVVYLLWKKKISLQVLCPFLNCFFIFIFCYWFVSVFKNMLQFSSVQSLSHVRLFATPWIAARQASLSITSSWSSLRLTSIELVMPSSHLILWSFNLHTKIISGLSTAITTVGYFEFKYIFTLTNEFHTFICFPISNYCHFVSAWRNPLIFL